MLKYVPQSAKSNYIIIVCIIIILVTPILFTQEMGWYVFNQSDATIGAVIGGVTAPFVGIFSIWLLYRTLMSSNKMNYQSFIMDLIKKQRHDADCLKSTFCICDKDLVVCKKDFQGEEYFKALENYYKYIKTFINSDEYQSMPEEEEINALIANYNEDESIETGLTEEYKTDLNSMRIRIQYHSIGLNKAFYDKTHEADESCINLEIIKIFFKKFPEFKHYYCQSNHIFYLLYDEGSKVDIKTTKALFDLYKAYMYPSEWNLLKNFFEVDNYISNYFKKLQRKPIKKNANVIPHKITDKINNK